MSIRPFLIVLALLALFATAASAFAQGDAVQGRFGRAEMTESTAGTYYRYFVPGEATIQVSVSGSVIQPGLYEVGVGTDLGRLLALSGGPRIDTRNNRQKRRIELRLFRPRTGADPIYATTMEDAAANPDAYPTLQEGDTLLVEVVQSDGFGWRDALTVAGGLSAVAVLLEVLTRQR